MNSRLRIEHPKRPRWPFLIASVLAVAVLLLFQIVPETLTSARGWVLLFVVGLPPHPDPS